MVVLTYKTTMNCVAVLYMWLIVSKLQQILTTLDQ